jgi:hypothetical protein
MMAVLPQWEPLLFRGAVVVAALLQNTSCILPFRPVIKQLFNFAPGKISLVTFLLLLTKFVGTNLNMLCMARRGDYMDVIHTEK